MLTYRSKVVYNLFSLEDKDLIYTKKIIFRAYKIC